MSICPQIFIYPPQNLALFPAHSMQDYRILPSLEESVSFCRYRAPSHQPIRKYSANIGCFRKIVYKTLLFPSAVLKDSPFFRKMSAVRCLLLIWLYNHIWQLFGLLFPGVRVRMPYMFTLCSYYLFYRSISRYFCIFCIRNPYF